jgi:hypothetical protein
MEITVFVWAQSPEGHHSSRRYPRHSEPVVSAEQAQASLIRRRRDGSDKVLLNTAKLMEDNPH